MKIFKLFKLFRKEKTIEVMSESEKTMLSSLEEPETMEPEMGFKIYNTYLKVIDQQIKEKHEKL